MIDGRCTDAQAVAQFGDSPSPGVCGICSRYDGPPRGAGDVIHAVARVTGVATVIHKVFGGDCNCDKRRQALNRAIPLTDDMMEHR